MDQPVVRPVGDRAVVVDLADGDTVRWVHSRLVADPLPGVLDVVPGARTVLLRASRGVELTELARRLRAVVEASVGPEVLHPNDSGGPGPDEVVLDVRFDGEDLDDVARVLGTTAAQVVAAHTAATWRVAFMGFAPGFGYLVRERSGDPGEHAVPLEVPRREHPRRAVPAGSVGLAGEYSGVYPRESPGGWQLVGRTEAALWDLDLEPPALLRPGLRVRFREVR